MHLGIYLLLLFWAGYTKRLGVIQGNKSNLDKYKKDIQENIINKISQDIIIKLQSI